MSQPKRPAPDDWRRRGQERYLRGAKLVVRAYRPYSPGWEHDHCVFCWTKFSCRGDDLKQGYSTEDGCHWICAQCFGDFREEFGWQLDEDVSQEPG